MNLPSTYVHPVSVTYDPDDQTISISVSRAPAFSTLVDRNLNWRYSKQEELIGVSIMEFPYHWNSDIIRPELLALLAYVLSVPETLLETEINYAFQSHNWTI